LPSGDPRPGARGHPVGIAEKHRPPASGLRNPETSAPRKWRTREIDAACSAVILEGKYTDGFLEYSGKDAPNSPQTN